MAKTTSSIDGLFASVRECLPLSGSVGAETLERAPATVGAYALLIHTGRDVIFRRSGLEHTFAPGWYVYAGSAYGPGGIRARLRRHFRKDKAVHWHIDDLTLAADAMDAVVVEGGSECGIVSALSRSPVFRPTVGGFGSSDCRVCAAHLLQFLP